VPTASGSWKQARSNRLTATSTITIYWRALERLKTGARPGKRLRPRSEPPRKKRGPRQAHFGDRGNDAVFHDLVSRIDKALAEPAVFIEDPAKAAH
jgi:hypothetical protein